jgi:hypothetical protein
MELDGITLLAFDAVDVEAFVVTFEGVVVESVSRSMISVLLRMLHHHCCGWMVLHLFNIIVNH